MMNQNAHIVPHLIEVARQHQWQLISTAMFHGDMPADLTPRGAIVDMLPTHAHVRSLLDQQIHVVRIGRFPHPDDHLMPAVTLEWISTGRLAAEHFAERDFKHVAFVGHEPWGELQQTFEAFATRASELGCTCHLLQIPLTAEDEKDDDAVSRWKARQERFTQWLKTLPMPVGLLAISDRIADRYRFWVTEAGLRVPEDVAVMGIGNAEVLCQCTPVPITSIGYDRGLIAKTAADLLAQLMDGQMPDQTTIKIPPSGVVTRQSTDIVAASDPNVIAAVRFMWDHINEDLSVDQIARHVGVSRRTLEKAFKRDLGRGINTEFQRRRLERVCELLTQTNLSIAEVAEALSFSGAKYLTEAFGHAYGMSPTQYRRQAQATTSSE